MTKNDIKYLSTSFESEQEHKKNKIINGIITKDRDYIIFGTKFVFFNISFNNEICQICKKEKDIKNKIQNLLFYYDSMKQTLISVFRCDYLKCILNIRHVTILKKMLYLTMQALKEAMEIINKNISLAIL